ncbi:MAG TPA: acyltransferase [Candidatus Sulfotelmatobacter sp.]|nr:acyltransferase [Candidatus Sulfotelmatobacter sp.]
MPKARTGYLATLDGWRSIAIAGVLLDHATGGILRGSRWYSFLRTGPNGVSVFFAVSGFLICSRLLEEEQLTGGISLRGFYIRRGCRILPAAFAYLAFIGVLGMVGIVTVTPLEWASCVLFFRNYVSPDWIHAGWGGYTIHYWSLAVEEHFYLLWPALLAFSGRVRARFVAGGMAVAIALWRWWDFHHHWMERHVPGLLFGSRTDVRLDGLLLGCLAALILAEPRWRGWLERHFTAWVWWACVVSYLLFQVLLRKHIYSILESMLLAGLVAGTVLRPSDGFGRLLENRVMKWIGRLSYSLYLWQQLFLIPGARYPFSLLQRFPINLAMLLLTAVLSYELLERPLIRVGHRLAPPPTPGRADLGEKARRAG